MSAISDLLTTPEAAAVAGVDIRDVNRMIDERILPASLHATDDSRRIWAGACALIRFYVDTAGSLTAQERKYAIEKVCKDAAHIDAVRLLRLWRRKRPHWKIEHEFLTLDLDRFIAEALHGHDRLMRAHAAVIEDEDILGGMPVLKGTRVPVYDVAASAAAGMSREHLRAAYPTLSNELIDLAVLYAKATPPRGRPRKTLSPAAVSARRSVRRRGA